MADEPELEDDTLELGEAPDEQDAPEEEAQSQEAPPAEDDDGEIAIEIEGDEGDEGEQDTPVIRRLREENKRLKRENAIASKVTAAPKIEVGPKPTLESCEWDEERFERDLDAWKESLRKSESQEAQAAEAAKHENEAFIEKHASYKARAAALPVAGFKEAEDKVIEALPESMQGVLVRYFPDAEKVVLALGRNPKHLDVISSITDPVAQLLALKDFAGKIKMVKRNAPPPPEERISGSGAISKASGDKRMAELEKKANATGDRSALVAYKAELKAKAK